MKELQEIVQTYREVGHRPAAIATVVNTVGSVYRRPGARMLICPDQTQVGQMRIGTVSGGCLGLRPRRYRRSMSWLMMVRMERSLFS
ncbi:XdhC family protein [Vacuolonema iberomarrocanum]|uniref:XdhC family protein n=1 Tax=Vacuolonema iberomarrocanum TaxID=3454632 RepID=UPI001A02FE83|nr:XdhC family protein [filamentous cyanobacterium LEGE 07170]